MKPKFRAWLIKENRMIDPVIGLDFSEPYPTVQWFESVMDVERNNVSDCFMDECELMQYTGLKDKNGKEIYEGDLLRHVPKDRWEDENYVSFEVFYHDNDCADGNVGFQMNRTHFHGAICGYSLQEKFLPKYTTQMMVTGNIYENPKLAVMEETT